MSDPTSKPPIRVFVVAPAMLCWGLEQLLQTARLQFETVGTADNLAQACPLVEHSHPDLVLLDLDGGYAEEAVVEFQARTSAKVLVLTSARADALEDRLVIEGVRGIVRKSEPPRMLLKALDRVHDGELWIDRAATGRIFMEMVRQRADKQDDPVQMKISTLTPRERQTIAAVATQGAVPGKVLAGRLCISEHTLRNHLSAIYAKLGLSNRLDLYAFATRHSLQELPDRIRRPIVSESLKRRVITFRT